MLQKMRIAVLISGTGRSLQNLLDRIVKGQIDAEIVIVISSRADAGGIEIARRAQIPIEIYQRSCFDSTVEYSQAIFHRCRESSVDLVVMAGFLKHVLIPDDFQQRVINVHPSLIPAFCGQGYYGLHVHEAVLESGTRISGCTVHYVDDQYDHGPIILQKTVPVLDDDTPDTLAARVFAAECEALPHAILELARQKSR